MSTETSHGSGADSLVSRLADGAIHRGADWLRQRQHPDGWWCGELEGDSILQSEFILLEAWRGRADSEACCAAARQLLRQQGAEGGWHPYPDGPLDISASVKAYFALKLTGHDPASRAMASARRAIRDAGGADAVNSFTRFYLALLGQIPYDLCPAVPPEAILLPAWLPVNIYRISAWSRTIFVPLSILWALRPSVEAPPERGIGELFLKPPRQWPALRRPGAGCRRLCSWETVFRGLDELLKTMERCGVRPLRKLALRRAERWMLDRFVDSDGLGAIFPPIIWSVIALRCLGYRDDSEEVRYNDRQLAGLMLRDRVGDSAGVGDRAGEGRLRLQPCLSPVWDTALSLRALAACGPDTGERGRTPDAGEAGSSAPARLPAESAEARGVAWLLKRQLTDRRGDWARTTRGPGGGWCFEHRNPFYPDIDDTIMALMSLRESAPEDGAAAGATARARDWILAMQNRDRGWGAFDRNNDAAFLCHVPFADHNAMIDPSTADITARVLEALAPDALERAGPGGRLPRRLRQAVRYVLGQQQEDGSWWGRWGVNYIYGTWQAVVGLRAAGLPAEHDSVRRGRQWLLRCQQVGGGWGESPDSYFDPGCRGRGPATASQTAWALLGLLATGPPTHEAVLRGIRYLAESQRDDGTWEETQFTGTGFPLVFYLRYHLYSQYFPLLALGQWRRALRALRASRSLERSSGESWPGENFASETSGGENFAGEASGGETSGGETRPGQRRRGRP